MDLFFIKNRKWLIGCLMLLGSLSLVAQERPNILWINCDDLGRELSCYGNPDVRTPNIDKLASEGVRYQNAYSNAPVCSSSRSSQITGSYPSAVNLLNHRTIDKKPLQEGIQTLMQLFQQEGYFCTNGNANNLKKKGKEDYNFSGTDFFDGTDWQERAAGQPFFAQVQIHEPHRTFVKDKEHPVDPATVQLPGVYPDHPLIRADWALYLESIQHADRKVGEIIARLQEEGVLENTIVIFCGDHGRPHLRDKQWLYEGGLAIPLIVRYPERFPAATVRDELISLVDVAVGTLTLADIEVPAYMHGKNVFGGEKRNYVFGFRQRCGDAVDDIRSITDGRYKLIWNRMPDRPYLQLSSYKKLQYPAHSVYHVLHQQGALKAPYSQLMADSRPEIEFYDLKNDPDEFVNLAGQRTHRKKQKKLFKILKKKMKVLEKNQEPESQAQIAKAKAGSAAYYEKAMKQRGLSPDLSDKELLEFWEKELLKK